MLASRVRMGSYKGNKYIGEVYLAQDDDFVKVNGSWIYRGSELEVEIPHIIQGEEIIFYPYMFSGTGSYLATPVTRVDSNNKSVNNMSNMFNGSSATTLDLSLFDTSNVANMVAMFNNSKATTLDLSSFDTSNVTNMYNMFNNSNATTLDLSSFDTSNVASMYNMFYRSSATTLDLSSFDTSKVTTMSNMFYRSSATTLDLSSFDTSNVTNMSNVFQSSKATTLDLSSFDTSNVTNMSNMFNGSKATTLDLSSFDTSNVTNMTSMFYNSKATTGYARTQADADRFNASSNKPASLNFTLPPLLAEVTIKVEYIDTPPDGYDVAFIPFVSNPPEWYNIYSNIAYEGQPISYSDYQAYTGTPVSLMTAHTTPIVVNAMELTNPRIGFKIKGLFYYNGLSVNGVEVSRNFYYVTDSQDRAYGVFFLPTNLVAGDEVVLRLRRND